MEKEGGCMNNNDAGKSPVVPIPKNHYSGRDLLKIQEISCVTHAS